MYFCITECLFHTSYLYQLMEETGVKWIVRNSRKLDKVDLDKVHSDLSKKHEVDSDDLQRLSDAYGGLSESEKYLATKYGVPKTHSLSEVTYITENTFDESLLNTVKKDTTNFDLYALIFLDVVLKDGWLDLFDGRIVNAHSAVLPNARGMYAIEQFILEHNKEQFENTAGASIHYVDSGIDTGEIIKAEKLNGLWDLESIWAVKAESYLMAFKLLRNYIDSDLRFTFKDTLIKNNNQESPIYFSKNFTNDKKILSEERFRILKEA